MKVSNVKLTNIQFTHEELCALDNAERAITEVAVAFGSEGALVSAETGECVNLSELNRVRTILDFFHDYRNFELV